MEVVEIRVYELASYIESKFNYPIFMNEMPEVNGDTQTDQNVNVGLVRMFPTITTSRQINRINAQVLLRSSDMQTLESKAWEIYEGMRTKTNFQIGLTNVIYCAATQPEFIPNRESSLFYYSVNLQFITGVD